jgi:hypothetical protein
VASRGDNEEAREILTLYAYHGDVLRVARALGVTTAQLARRIKELHLTRKIAEAVKGRGEFKRTRTPGGRGPVLRRKGGMREEAAGAPDVNAAKAAPALPPRTRLVAVLQETRGDRARTAASLKLGAEELERALERHRLTATADRLLREHLRFLIGKNAGAVGAELRAAIERAGLQRELDAERARRHAEEMKPRPLWARARQLAARRGFLQEIGALAEAAAELRAGIAALGLAGDDAALRRALRLRPGELRRLRDLM